MVFGVGLINDDIYIYPRLTPVAMATKVGTKLAVTRLRKKNFAPIVGFLRMCHIECCQSHFPPTDPRCHGNEIWDKFGYNSACVRDFCEIFAPIVGFSGMGLRMLPIAFS